MRSIIIFPMSDLGEMILGILFYFGVASIVVSTKLILLNYTLWYMPWTWIRIKRITEVLFFITFFVGFALLLFFTVGRTILGSL